MWSVCTCVCESCVNVKTCRSSPSTATRCPCLGPVGGVCGPQLRPWSALWLRPAESCAPRWIWTTESRAASAVPPYSWENLSWRLTERRGRTCEETNTRWVSFTSLNAWKSHTVHHFKPETPRLGSRQCFNSILTLGLYNITEMIKISQMYKIAICIWQQLAIIIILTLQLSNKN